MYYKIGLIISLFVFNSVAQFKDSTNKLFLKKMITPVVLSAASFTFLNQNIKHKQIEIYQNNFKNFNTKIDDYSTYLPTIAYLGLSISNSEKRNERLIKGAMAITVTNGTTWMLKRIFKLERPDKSDFLTFPSGHATNAFNGAALLNKEFGGKKNPLIGILGYSTAITTGFLRMANNKHYLADVLAGAAIGIGGTEISYFLYPKIQKIIHRKNKNQVFIPYYDGKFIGLNSSITF